MIRIMPEMQPASEQVRKGSSPRARHVTRLFWFIVTGLPLAGILLSVLDPGTFDAQQHWFRSYAQQHPLLGPLAFVAFQAAQVVLTPINHYAVGYLGGFLYGTGLGSVYNYIGRIAGHSVAFWLARRYGRRIAERFVPIDSLTRFDRLFQRGAILLFLAYFLPLFPDDELSYLAGMSRLPVRTWLLVNLFGQVGGSIGLAYLGAGVSARDPLFWAYVISLPAFGVLYWFFNRRSHRKTSMPVNAEPSND